MENTNAGIVFREIHKNGWLRRTDMAEKDSSRFWVVFCVHDDVEPRLEGYVDQKQAATHAFLWNSSLRNVLHLSPTLCATEHQDFEFCVNFYDHRALRMAAPTYQDMYDWVQTVSRKLTDMKILSPKENIYSKGPGADRLPTRDPTSPLPLPPRPPPSFRVQIQAPIVTPDTSLIRPQPQVTEPEFQPLLAASSVNLPNQTEPAAVINQVQRSDTVPNFFTFDNIPAEDIMHSTPPRSISSARSDRREENVLSVENSNSSYESLFLASSYSPTGTDRSIASSIRQEGENSHYAALREYRSQASVSQPRPTRTQRAVEREENGRQLTLREHQVLQLKREMSHLAGVRLQLRRRDCKDDVALVDTFGAVWVAGWKQREHPMLYNALHIGDQVISLAGIPVPSATAARDILKSCTTPYVEMIVKRLPQGRTMTLMRGSDRETDNEGFGLELQGNEVTGVSGAALSSGLPPLAPAGDPSMPPGTFSSWTLTEES
ncbi:uncharacterized protein LOC105688335 isoform X2 [Athalia rosae]|uniref:uncharacterized protein LOC105688335 isoform X2 n=1 Tax=Athalia rosae TaxID=37344 RepID=UPI00203375E8|nr:uncharacterized protein LOC105688335 isoform X2 [Athalia rosae]